MRIIGIDPGARITGYGCVESLRPGQPRLIEAGAIRLRSGAALSERLLELDADLGELFKRLAPGRVCIEKLYSHYKRPMTAVVMGHARGVVLLAARRCGAQISELAATEVKKAITGFGHASKAQIQASVQAQLRLADPPRPEDVADALAIALCAARRTAIERIGAV